MSLSTTTLYDEMPYERLAFPETFPKWLNLLHRLYTGSKAPLPENPEILEIGCGMGLNSCAIAAALPHGRITGIDLSSTHIAEAKKTKEYLGLSNVTFLQADILTHELPNAHFNFVIAHGIYSWVPHPVQESILAKSSSCLRPHGLLLLSYNTLPGWAMRGLIRRIMTNATDASQLLTEQVRRSRELIQVAAPLFGDTSRLAAPLRFEVKRVLQSPPSYTAHEYLAPHNDAFYFGQIVQRCASHKLSYIGEARPWADWRYAIDATRQRSLQALDLNWIAREELADLLMNRSFRRSIFRKPDTNEAIRNAELAPSSPIFRSIIRDLHLRLVASMSSASDTASSFGLPLQGNLAPTTITSTSGRQRQLMSREEQLLVRELEKTPNATLSFDNLLSTLNGAVTEDSALEILERLFLEQYLDLSEHSEEHRWDPTTSIRVTKLARYQSSQGLPITDNWLRPLPFSPQERSLLAILDGTQSIDDLVTLASTLPPPTQAHPHNDPLTNQAPPALASMIQRLERAGLLDRT